MITAVVNSTVYLKPELLLTADGVPVTTKLNADWTKTARLLGSVTTATPTITHVASGKYDISVPLNTVGYWSVEYSVVVDGETVYFDPVLVQVITAAQADPAAALSASVVTVSSPVATDQTITLVRGDDYLNADGRALSWSVSSPDLTGASVTLTIRTYAGATVLEKAMTVSGATVRVDVTADETGSLELGTPRYKYEIVADLAGGGTATLVTGTVWVRD